MTAEVCNQTSKILLSIFDSYSNLETRRSEDGTIHQLLDVLENYKDLNPKEVVSDDPLNRTQEELLSQAFSDLEKIASKSSSENQVLWNEAVFSLATIITAAPEGSPMFCVALSIYGEVIDLTDEMVDKQAVAVSLHSAGFPVAVYDVNGDCIIFVSDICKTIQDILFRSGVKVSIYQNDTESIEIVPHVG